MNRRCVRATRWLPPTRSTASACGFVLLFASIPAAASSPSSPISGARVGEGAGGQATKRPGGAAFLPCFGSQMQRLLRCGSALAAVGVPRTRRQAPNVFMQSEGGYSTSKKIKTPGQGADVYKAKQSLGQNFLVDQNVAKRICSSLEDTSENGRAVVEVGPGKGALTAILLNQYPQMKAIELDQRSIEYLNDVMPSLDVRLKSVLDVDWSEVYTEAGEEQLSVIGNLPYYITSQILFSLVDASPYVRRAIVTMQLEVAQRVAAKPGSKTYGILSVVCQLYGTPRLLFKIPPTVFQPQPDVDSALICVDFPKEKPHFDVNMCHLRTVLRASFQQRRKMMRQSLKAILQEKDIKLPDELGTRRPESLAPQEFIELTKLIYGEGVTPEGIQVWRGALDGAGRE